jgi:hypothetical protein
MRLRLLIALGGAALLSACSASSALAANCTVEDAFGIHIGHMTTSTEAPDDIAATSAELQGGTTFIVNSGSEATKLEGNFFYGTDPENEIGNATPFDSSTEQFTLDFSATVGALSADTTYYYQHIAIGHQKDPADVPYSKTCEGDIVSFRTLLAPPVPVALPPTDVTGESATLQGTVNPLGADTTASFTYTPTDGGGPVVTTAQDVGSGSSPAALSQPIEGLDPNTSYSVVVSAHNANNSATSPSILFTTGGSEPRARTGSATDVSATGATLNAGINPEGDDTDFHFEYGPDTNYGSTTAPEPAGDDTTEHAVSTPITGLVPGRTYHYRAVATNPAGTAMGEDASFTATSDAVVQTLHATGIGESSATLNATVDPRGLATQAWFDWVKEVSLHPVFTHSTDPVLLDGVEGAVPFQAQITGLEPNSLYVFRGHAVDSIGASYGSNMTLRTAERAPDAETGASSDPSADGASVLGTVNPHGSPTRYRFQYGLNEGYGTSTSPVTAGSGRDPVAVETPLSGLLPNRTYHYRLLASNGGGTTVGEDATFSTVAAPLATTALAAEVSDSGATLLGQVDPRGRATSWWFEYGQTMSYGTATGAFGAGSGIGQVPVASSLTGLSPGTTYHYRVVAQNADGLLTRGADQVLTTDADPLPPNLPPSAVTGASRGRSLAGQVDANGAPTTYYFQYGRSAGYGRATPLGSLAGSDGFVPVSGRVGRLGPGRFHYRLVATSANGTTYGTDRVMKIKRTAKARRGRR